MAALDSISLGFWSDTINCRICMCYDTIRIAKFAFIFSGIPRVLTYQSISLQSNQPLFQRFIQKWDRDASWHTISVKSQANKTILMCREWEQPFKVSQRLSGQNPIYPCWTESSLGKWNETLSVVGKWPAKDAEVAKLGKAWRFYTPFLNHTVYLFLSTVDGQKAHTHWSISQ